MPPAPVVVPNTVPQPIRSQEAPASPPVGGRWWGAVVHCAGSNQRTLILVCGRRSMPDQPWY
jgi:hypothetical protein